MEKRREWKKWWQTWLGSCHSYEVFPETYRFSCDLFFIFLNFSCMRLVSQSVKRLLYVNQAGNWLQLRCKTLSHNKTITIDLWTHTHTHRRIILTTLMLFGWQELVGCQLVVAAASLSLSFSFPLESPAQPLTHCIGMATATTTPAFIFFFFFL